MAAGEDSSALAATDSINFFRVCCIILKDVPRILTDVFKGKVQAKHGHKWTDDVASGKWLQQEENWHLKLLPEQIGWIESGNTEEWDLPLLFQLLLHSSLCLLADRVPGLQVSLVPGSDIVTVTAQSTDLTNVLKQNDEVIFKLPTNEVFLREVTKVQKNHFSVTRRFCLPPSLQGMPSQQPLIVDTVYVCTPEWHAVEKLSCLHSDSFSHCKEAHTSNTELRKVVQYVESAYNDLSVPPEHILRMKNIETEPVNTEYYQKKWVWAVERQRMHLKQSIKSKVDDPIEEVPEMKENSEAIRKDYQDQISWQTEGKLLPMSGRSTEEYRKMMERSDKIINQLTSAKCSGILAIKLHSARVITDPVYEEALNAGPGVVETVRIRPVINAVLAKVEMNTENYYKFLDVLQELGGLQDTVQLLQAPLQQLDRLNPDPVTAPSQINEPVKHSGLMAPERESCPSDQSFQQNEVTASSTGRNTDEYLKILKRCDTIINQLASAKCSGILADKLHSTQFITDATYEDALNVGPGVVETSRIRPVIDAVLSKVEMNADNYYIFLAALLELGGLDDLLQLIEAPLQQSDYLTPDPTLPLSQSAGMKALGETAKELQTHQREIEEGVQRHSEQIDELQHDLTDAKSCLEEDIATVQLQQVDISQLVSKQTGDIAAHGARIEAHESRIKGTEIEIDTLQQTQTDTASKVSQGLESLKQMSTELDETERKLAEMQTEVGIIAESEIQLFEEAEKAINLVQHLTVAEEETTEHVTALEDRVHEMQADVHTIKEDVELIRQDSKGIDDPLKKLNPSHFESDISYYSEKHHQGTREWLFDQVNKWHKQTPTNKNQYKIHLITGNPGMGKSVIAAKICTMAKERGILAGYFFFQHHKSRRSNPKMMVQTLAHQFCSTIPEYQTKALDVVSAIKLGSMMAPELFTCLILEPLHQLPLYLPNMYVIIDALDECDFDSRTDLLKLIVREFVKLPKWISVVLTSRPDQKILQRLRKVKPVIELHPKDPNNIRDITVFLSDLLRSKINPDEFEAGIELLVRKSEGMFLYFHYAVDTLIEEEELTLESLKTLLPDGIDDYYDQNFQRLYRELGKEKYQALLQAVIAARADLPQALVAPLLQICATEAAKVIETVSVLLPVHNDHIHMFHKSVRDWLTDRELAGEYAVDSSTGHQHLASLCYSVLQQIKADATTLAEFSQSPSKRYVLENVVYHLCNTNSKLQSLTEKLVSIFMDLQFMYYRLLLSKGTPEELLEDFTLAKIPLQSNAQVRQKVQDCEAFIKKHAQLLGTMPHLVFQCAINEPDAFSQQLNIDCYKADPKRFFPDLKVYLEVTNKPQSFASALITFTCSDTITSFVQSADESLIICSDGRGKVYIWNKQTAELLHDKTMEDFQLLSPICECSISPDGKLIAYGSIKEAMDLDGNIVPLIPRADSDTTACAFGPNGKKMIAWSYYVDGVFRLMSEIGKSFQPQFYVELWDLETGSGRKLEIIAKKEKRPTSACFSHNGSHIICGHRDGKMVQWETASAEVVAICNTDGTAIKRGSLGEPLLLHNPSESVKDDPIYHVTCSPNGHLLAACSRQGILIWDAVALNLLQTLTTGLEMASERQPPRFTYCSFADDSKHIVAGTTNGWLKAWELQPSEPAGGSDELFVLKVSTKTDGSSNSVACCRFDQQLNVICAIQNMLRICSYEVLLHSTKISQQQPQAAHPRNASTCSFLPDGHRAITCGNDTLCLWHVPTNSLLASALGSVAGYLHRLSQDGKLLLTFGDRNYIQVWDTENLTQKHMLTCQRQKNIPPGPGPDDPDSSSTGDICHCAVSNRGLVVGGTGDGCLYLWHGEDYKSVKVIQTHQSLITFCEFSPDGQRFISADMDGKIALWQLIDGGGVLEVNKVSLEEHEDSIEQVYFSPGQAQRIVSCSCDGTLHLYNGPSGDLLKKMKGHNVEVLRVTFSSDGSLIASGDANGRVLLWDGYTGELKKHLRISGGQMLDLAFICGDKFVCTRDLRESCVQVCDVATGSHVSRLGFSAPVCTMAASPSANNPWFLCGLKDESVKFVMLHIITEPELCG